MLNEKRCREGVRNLRFEQLQYFETLLQEGSYNKAANKLHITQPALTANIKNMEKELGVTLLERDNRGISLTEEGKTVLEFAKAITLQYQQMIQTLHKSAPAHSGKISIIASLFITEIVLEEFMHTFHSKHGEITLRLIENEMRTVPQFLLNTNCTFAIITRLTAEDESKCMPGMLLADEEFYIDQFIYLPLFQDTFGLCMAKNNTLSDLREIYPTIIAERNQPITTFRLADMQSANSLTRLILSSSNTKLHIHAMQDAGAVCSLPYFVHKQYFAEESSIIWRPYSNKMNVNYYLVYPVDHVLSAGEQLFIDELQEYLTQMKFK